MRILSLVVALCLAPTTTAQVQDIGLTVAIGQVPQIGQLCGPVTCAALPVGNAQGGQTLTFLHASAPITPYVLGIGFPGPCVTIAGVNNGLLLDSNSLLVAAGGLTSNEPTIALPCQQGLALYVLPLPTSAPVGMVFRVQGLGVSNSGPIGFGPALEIVIQ